MAEGLIFNIQRFCINDGPGIRTTVFFKGCPLSCLWCHNPESQKKAAELLFFRDKCINCGKCALACENGVHIFDGMHIVQREKCIACRSCEAVCRYNALELTGRTASADEVIKTVLADKEFFDDSGGGLTLSGGEPFMQPEFMLELLKKAKESSVHTCVETCGFTSSQRLLGASEYVDIFLFDYKLSDSELHRKYTGVGNEAILDNLRLLSDNGSKIILRCPVIPGVNDNEHHFRAIGETAEKFSGITGVEIAPYHELGLSKSDSLGKSVNAFSVPSAQEAQEYIDRVKRYTEKNVKRM